MIEDAEGRDAQVPQVLKDILKNSLALRAARDAGEVGAEAVATGVSDLRRRVDDLLTTNVTHAGNARLLKHLGKESKHLFTFLERPDVEATNWKGEQAIRPAVVNRKSWGGNFTWAGADTQEVLSSVPTRHRTSPGQGPHLGPRSPADQPYPKAGRLDPAGRRGGGLAPDPRARTTGPHRPCPVAPPAASPHREHNASSPIRSGW